MNLQICDEGEQMKIFSHRESVFHLFFFTDRIPPHWLEFALFYCVKDTIPDDYIRNTPTLYNALEAKTIRH